jgi:hypothetical protein
LEEERGGYYRDSEAGLIVGLPSAKRVKMSAALSIFVVNPILVVLAVVVVEVEAVVVEMPDVRDSEDGEGGGTAVVAVVVDVDGEAAPDKGADDERWRFLNRSNTLAREVLFSVVCGVCGVCCVCVCVVCGVCGDMS